MTKNKFVELAAAQVGKWCYVWGGNGQDMTAMNEEERGKWITKREKEEKNRTRVKALYGKLEAAGVNPIRGGDCSGFVFWCLKELGVISNDHNAEMFHNLCAAVEEPEAGDLCFVLGSDGKATHVGIYDGEQYIHCKGRDDGVVREKKYKWHAYGSIPYLISDEPEPEEEDGTKYVFILGNVHVRKEPRKTAEDLFTAHKGDSFVFLGDSEPDERGCVWYAVATEKGTGYVSSFMLDRKKYTEVR